MPAGAESPLSAAAAAAPSPTNQDVALATGGTAVPKHVRTWYYYGGISINGGLPASYVAAHADFVTLGWDQTLGDNFLNAGGKYAVYYTDPHLVPNCTPTSCAGPMGNTTPESAWFHAPSGARLMTSLHQAELSVVSPAIPSAYARYVASVVAGHKTNAVFADDTDSIYDPSYYLYKFGAVSAEMTALGSSAQAKFLAGQTAILQAATRPVVYNGSGMGAADASLLGASNVLGRLNEGCAVNTYFRVNDSQGNPANDWAPTMNGMLFAYAHHKYGICLSTNVAGGNAIADRLYGFASSMLIFDPTYSVTFPNYASSDSAGGEPVQIFPEYDIYPTAPLTSPGTNVATLKSTTGVYVREFGQCYQNGTAIGRCATLLNSTRYTTEAIPALRQSYSRHLVLDAHSSYGGGKAAWASGRPTSLAPETGLVVLQ